MKKNGFGGDDNIALMSKMSKGVAKNLRERFLQKLWINV